MAEGLAMTAAEAAGAKSTQLTPAAATVTLQQLFLMNHGDWASGPAGLTVKDIASLREVFADEDQNVGSVAAAACCCSSIVCCSTAASEPSAVIVM